MPKEISYLNVSLTNKIYCKAFLEFIYYSLLINQTVVTDLWLWESGFLP